MTKSSPWIPSWEAKKLLNIPDGCMTCNATTQKGWMCRMPIARHNRWKGEALLQDLNVCSLDLDKLEVKLYQIADCLLCQRWHVGNPGKVEEVVDRWFRTILKANSRERAKYRSSRRAGPKARENSRAHKNENNCSSGPRYNSGTQPPSYDEQDHQWSSKERSASPSYEEQCPKPSEPKPPKPHPDEELCRKQAEDRVRDEQARRGEGAKATADEERRQKAREAQEEAERLRQEQEARAEKERREKARAAEEAERRRQEQEAQRRAKNNIISWDAAWARYEQQWGVFLELGSRNTPGQIKAAFPIPLRNISTFSWDMKDEGFEIAVASFFRCMPDASPDSVAGRTKLRKILKTREAIRWHPDKLMQRFPAVGGEVECPEVLQLVTKVLQVIIKVMSGL